MGKDLSPSDIVFGNVRWMRSGSHVVLDGLPLLGVTRDTQYLSMLARHRPHTVRAHIEPNVLDVDDESDLRLAEYLCE